MVATGSNPNPTAAARVVVTGIGLTTGLGLSAPATWTGLKAGGHAFRVLDIAAVPPYCGAAAAGGDADAPVRTLLDRAAQEAYDDAGLARLAPDFDRARAAVVIGMSKGDLARLGAIRGALDSEPAWWRAWPAGAASALAARWDFRGPVLAPVAACATGLVAALQGAALIRRGTCDLAVVGAGDSSLDPLVLAAFRRMGILARDAERDPGRAVRPWARDRAGFLVGQGAGVLVLERAQTAHARGVAPYAELAGGACGGDAYHMTDLDPDPTGLAHLIGRALEHAGVVAEAIDYVNVHGTATRAGDPLECRALRQALGRQAGRVSCSASKSQIGHLLGAAGAAELAITCLAVHHGFAPPTLNLTDPDPECDLDGTPHVGRAREIRAALKLSIGFGGHLVAAVVRRCDPRRS
jgi:3-oxoacyl-[acyl-carrier-protein] synthase II